MRGFINPNILFLIFSFFYIVASPISLASNNSDATSTHEQVQAPDFTLKFLDGAETSLKDYRGQVVMLNFWATWCAPCRQEMPEMQGLWQKFKDKGFVILAVSEDEGHEKRIQGFVKKLKLTFPILLDPQGEVSDQYKLTGLPTTFLIDRHGKLVTTVVGLRDWRSSESVALIASLLEDVD